MRRMLVLALLLLGCSIASAALIFQAGSPTDYIRLANLTGAPTTYPLSLALVAKVTASNNNRYIIQIGRDGTVNGWSWQIFGTDEIGLYRHNTTYDVSTADIVEGVWCFIGMSHGSSTSHRLFVYNYETRAVVFNETNATSVPAPGVPTNYSTIGGYDFNGTVNAEGFDGTMSWIAVYNRDFTGAGGDYFKNIAQLGPYIHGAPVYLYSFQEMTGTTVRNRTTISNDGTMTNFQASPWIAQGLPWPMSW